MNYHQLSSELVTALRVNKTQGQINQKLGYTFNKVYRWESGRTPPTWSEFLQFCKVVHAPIEKALKEAYSFHKSPKEMTSLTKHFVGTNTQETVAKAIGVSRHTISRWLKGGLAPTTPQILALMDFGSIDFLHFLELLTRNQTLPTIAEQLKSDHIQLNLFYKYPWLSALLSAIDLDEYKKKTTDEFLAQKAKLPLKQVQAAIRDLLETGMLEKVGKHLETREKRIALRGSLEGRKKIADYVFSRSLSAVRTSFGSPNMRFSWKLFSLNRSHYEKILQKYTEFFNELGTIIDSGQKDTDKIYLFAASIIDFDEISEYEEK